MSRRRRRGRGGLRLVVLRPGARTDEIAIGKLLYPEKVERPHTRGECEQAVRPCPFVGCRHNLFFELGRDGTIFARPDVEPWDVQHSCALDLAAVGGMSQYEVAEVLQVSRAMVQQIEQSALGKLARVPTLRAWAQALLGRLASGEQLWQDRSHGTDAPERAPERPRGRARPRERLRRAQ